MLLLNYYSSRAFSQVTDKTMKIEPSSRLDPSKKLENENVYLKSRIQNLEVFKRNFFTQGIELNNANERIKLLEQQLGLDTVKQRITDNSNDDDKITGEITEFLHQTLLTQAINELAKLAFQTLDGWIDDSSLRVKKDDQIFDYDLKNTQKEHNHNLIAKFSGKGELIETNDYIIINHDHMSLLAKLPPSSNDDLHQQRIKFLQLVGLATNSRLDFLIKDEELETLRKNIYQVFKRTNAAFEELQDDMAMHAIGVSEIYLNMEKILLDALHKTDLAEQHIAVIKDLITETKGELNILLTTSMTLDEAFLQVLKKLEAAYSKKYNDDSE